MLNSPRLSLLTLALCAFLAAPGSHAVETPREPLVVVGVIASDKADGGVAMIRMGRGLSPKAVRAGEEVAPGIVLTSIEREYVHFRVGHRVERARVGDEVSQQASSRATTPQAPVAGASYNGLERRGNDVRVTSALRDHIVKRELGTVLMQAAAVPYYMGGRLSGFRLWEIDEGSVFDLAGFKDGDIVTAINGNDLTDVGTTVRMLHALKEEPEAKVTVVREGTEQTISIVVQ